MGVSGETVLERERERESDKRDGARDPPKSFDSKISAGDFWRARSGPPREKIKRTRTERTVYYAKNLKLKTMLQYLVGRETWATLEIWATPLPHTEIQKNTKNVPSNQFIQALLRPF